LRTIPADNLPGEEYHSNLEMEARLASSKGDTLHAAPLWNRDLACNFCADGTLRGVCPPTWMWA
jgi:hypothetical protein